MSTPFDQVAFAQWLKSAIVTDQIRPEVAALVHLEPAPPRFIVAGTPAEPPTIALSWRLVVDATFTHR